MIKQGSKWGDANGKEFRVIQLVELDGHVWVHYIDEKKSEDSNREYSCYQESFLSRFRSMPE